MKLLIFTFFLLLYSPVFSKEVKENNDIEDVETLAKKFIKSVTDKDSKAFDLLFLPQEQFFHYRPLERKIQPRAKARLYLLYKSQYSADYTYFTENKTFINHKGIKYHNSQIIGKHNTANYIEGIRIDVIFGDNWSHGFFSINTGPIFKDTKTNNWYFAQRCREPYSLVRPLFKTE